ncbi:L-idonate 5-dehydrogenase [Sagittula stellata]|uniref:IdnD L-idonate 5-dehydrogenase n=1 Tax=Sagittula stellata (strain ATCC 700073 / DSM 11524 / E-37) TaxID=388399 RepID=A3JX74_SAGS3|nr:L-idonate 5-dehydrogenase [Sagittula stellata]EBA10110.1 IdnD L-idonate 5-dehydrogenase [Sagittula stellata E-37]
MKAVVIHGARDLRIEDMAPAAQPGPGEVQVHVANGGICGSDLHYYLHGGFGAIRVREPMALGHEVSGVVSDVGDGVEGLAVGDKVAVNPSRPCARCEYCLRGQPNQCLDMRFNGSAMRMPHEQGLFRETLTLPATLVERFAPEADLAFAAMTEPLAVCLHAVRQAGSLLGKTVLVAGSGPIGCLTIAAARLAGATRIVATDISDTPLGVARAMGAHETINLAATPEGLAPFQRDKGQIDVSFECSGAPQALGGLLTATRAGGTVVLVGMGGEAPLPLQLTVAKELTLRGAFRFHEEFATAARVISEGRIDLAPLLTGVHDTDDAVAAFDLAADKSRAMKVQIRFSGA